MEYTKSVSGAWLDADKIESGVKAKLVSEVEKKESRFKDPEGNAKTENVGKIRLQGADEAVNIRLNWTSVYGLIDAHGSDSKDWIGKILTVKTLDAMVGDTMRTIVYLVPEGFELAKNEEKKMVIRKIEKIEAPEVVKRQTPPKEIEEDFPEEYKEPAF